MRLCVWMSAVFVATGLSACSGANQYSSQELSPTAARPSEASPDTFAAKSSVCNQFSENKSTLVSLTEIASVLRGGDFKKQEFETTDQFKARLASRIKSANQKTNLQGDYFYFAIPIPADLIKFDADQSRMTVGDEYLGLFGLHTASGDKGRLHVTSSRRVVGSYIGQNSFGVKKDIVRVEEQQLDVNVPGGEYSKWPSNFKQIVFFPPRDQAKKAKENLVVLFAGRFKPPYFTTENSHFTPKIDAPYDITTHTEIIHIDADCAAIFDKAHKTKIADLSLSGP